MAAKGALLVLIIGTQTKEKKVLMTVEFADKEDIWTTITLLSPLEIHHVKDVLREDIMTLLVPEKIMTVMVTVRGVLLANIKMKQEKKNVRSVPLMGTALEAPLRI